MSQVELPPYRGPRGEVIEIPSNSYDLSIFSSKVGSHRDEGMGVVPGGSSSVSIEELWPDIDKLDGATKEGTSM
jgi:hypothetical protein